MQFKVSLVWIRQTLHWWDKNSAKCNSWWWSILLTNNTDKHQCFKDFFYIQHVLFRKSIKNWSKQNFFFFFKVISYSPVPKSWAHSKEILSGRWRLLTSFKPKESMMLYCTFPQMLTCFLIMQAEDKCVFLFSSLINNNTKYIIKIKALNQ